MLISSGTLKGFGSSEIWFDLCGGATDAGCGRVGSVVDGGGVVAACASLLGAAAACSWMRMFGPYTVWNAGRSLVRTSSFVHVSRSRLVPLAYLGWSIRTPWSLGPMKLTCANVVRT